MAIDKIVIQYEAQVAEFKKELDAIKGQLKGVETTAAAGAKKTEQAFDRAGGGLNKFSANLKNLAATMGLAFGAQEIIRFAQSSVKAASDSLQAEGKLRTALKGREAIVERLTKRASELQKVTIVDDDTIVAQQAFLAAQGLTEEQINRTIDAAIQLADVKNVDLKTATEALGKTFEGQKGKLAALGDEFGSLTEEELKSGKAIDIVNQKYIGFAENTAATGTGRLKQLENAFGDLQEEIGKQLLPTLQEGALTLNSFIQSVDWGMVFGRIGEITKEYGEPLKNLLGSFTDIFDAFTANMSAGEKTASMFDAIGVAVNVSTTPIRVLANLFKGLTDNVIVPLIETGQKLIAWFNDVREGGGFVGAVFNGIAIAAGNIVGKLEDVAQFIGILDSDEERLHKKRLERDAEVKKSNDEYIDKNFKQQKERTAEETRLMELQAKRAYLGQKLTKAEEKEYKKLTAAKNESTDATKDNTDKTKENADATEKAKTKIEQVVAEIAKLTADAETLASKGDYIGAEKAATAAGVLQGRLNALKTAVDEYKKAAEDAAKPIETISAKPVSVDTGKLPEIPIPDAMGIKVNLHLDETTAEKAKEASIKKVEEIETKMGEVFGAVNSVLGPAMDALNGYFDLQLNNLEKEKNQRLANENLTAEERLRIEEEYEAKKNAILAEQFEVSRGSQIIQAIMSSAQAALNAFTSTALLFAPAAPAAAAAAAAFGALQIGIIAAQPNPYKFFEGTDYLQLGGNPRGKDTIPVMAHEGEAIIPTGKNLQYPGLAKSWIDGNLDGYIHKKFISPALMEQQREMEADFADKIAASMALQMTGGFDDYRLFRAIKEQTAIQRVGFENLKQTRKKLRGA